MKKIGINQPRSQLQTPQNITINEVPLELLSDSFKSPPCAALENQ